MSRRSIGLAFGVHISVSFGGGEYLWGIEMSGKGEGRKGEEEWRREGKKKRR